MSEGGTGEVTERWATTLADIAREHGTPCFVYLVPEIDARTARNWPSNAGPPLDDRPEPPPSAYEEHS